MMLAAQSIKNRFELLDVFIILPSQYQKETNFPLKKILLTAFCMPVCEYRGSFRPGASLYNLFLEYDEL
jgi:hypothetical protein